MEEKRLPHEILYDDIQFKWIWLVKEIAKIDHNSNDKDIDYCIKLLNDIRNLNYEYKELSIKYYLIADS